MKAKYYPHGHLLDTAFPHVTSTTWQGIMHGLDLLKKGVICRVRDGANINIWRDNWLPRDSGLQFSAKKNRTKILSVQIDYLICLDWWLHATMTSTRFSCWRLGIGPQNRESMVHDIIMREHARELDAIENEDQHALVAVS